MGGSSPPKGEVRMTWGDIVYHLFFDSVILTFIRNSKLIILNYDSYQNHLPNQPKALDKALRIRVRVDFLISPGITVLSKEYEVFNSVQLRTVMWASTAYESRPIVALNILATLTSLKICLKKKQIFYLT